MIVKKLPQLFLWTNQNLSIVPPLSVVGQIQAYGLGEMSIEHFRSYLSSRIQRVKIGDTFSKWEMVRRGVPQGSVLGPIFFNVHIHDLYYHIKQANLNAYADDEQLYSSDKDLELNTRLEHELGIGNSWYERNDMIVNPDKHQAMVLGVNSNYEFSFPVKNSVDLLDVTIDKDFSFNSHISQICVKVNKQFSVLKRFKNSITSNVMLRLYKAFILPHLQYNFLIWHVSGTSNCDKLESLNNYF